uniref:Uncharacterized protein n=1 Tax=Anopheles atroparvus TaxID=41427 RepID=A0AAG5DSH3_ANOAO
TTLGPFPYTLGPSLSLRVFPVVLHRCVPATRFVLNRRRLLSHLNIYLIEDRRYIRIRRICSCKRNMFLIMCDIIGSRLLKEQPLLEYKKRPNITPICMQLRILPNPAA